MLILQPPPPLPKKEASPLSDTLTRSIAVVNSFEESDSGEEKVIKMLRDGMFRGVSFSVTRKAIYLRMRWLRSI